MRVLMVVLATGLVAFLAVTFADVLSPSVINMGSGSVGYEPESSGLHAVTADASCAEDVTDVACPRRYAFAPDQSLMAWVSVRNDGPVAITLRGPSQPWLQDFSQIVQLAEPVRVFDGGDPLTGADRDPARPFVAVDLPPGGERAIGVEFRTTADVKEACRRWSVGSGMIFESVSIEWDWLVSTHARDIAFAQPIEFLAPSASDCSR